MATALALAPPEGYVPDFLSPPPSGPDTDIRDELDLIRATPPAQVAHDLAAMEVPVKPRIRSLPALVDTLGEYWDRAIEPDWPRIRAFLRGDIQHRARTLVEHGPARLFAELHPMVHWHGDHMTVEMIFEAELDLSGRGLLLVPSAFLWTRPFAIVNEPWQPMVIYPARGLATLWDDAGQARMLGPLMGETRARILAAVEAPASTTELAQRLGLTAGGVSQHLKVLRAAGLVSAQRAGREVLYARSETGAALLAGAG
jgi:DNA-binding transcriptional ArsR family regulator